MPSDASNPRRNVVSTNCFVGADNSISRATRRLHTGDLIFVNKAPVIWYDKQHNTVETSTFSRDFIALKTATKLVKSIWYKFWMFGIPIEGPYSMLCDNEYVYKNVSTTDSTLKKKNVIICYHNWREAVADGVSPINKEGTATNLADLFNNMLVHIRRKTLLDKFTCWFICKFFFNSEGVVFFPRKGYPFLPIRGWCMDAVLLYGSNRYRNASS